MASVLSVQVGLPREYPPEEASGPTVRTGLVKLPAAGPVHVAAAGLEGDGQASLGPHGGLDRAVLSYAGDHYDLWRAEYRDFDFSPGTFGENLTVTGLDEGQVCLGDIYRVGGARIQVSMPRSPCAKLEWRTGIPGFLTRVQASARIGWLHRVLEEGPVAAGDAITLLERPCPDWTVMRTYRVVEAVKARDATRAAEGRELAALEWVGAGYLRRFRELLEQLG